MVKRKLRVVHLRDRYALERKTIKANKKAIWDRYQNGDCEVAIATWLTNKRSCSPVSVVMVRKFLQWAIANQDKICND